MQIYLGFIHSVNRRTNSRQKRFVTVPPNERVNIRIKGINEHDNETKSELRKHLVNLFQTHLNSTITGQEIGDIWRVGAKNKLRPRSILINFLTEKREKEFMRYTIGESPLNKKGIYINLDMDYPKIRKRDVSDVRHGEVAQPY